MKQWLFPEFTSYQTISRMKEILSGSQKCKEVIQTLYSKKNPSEGLDDMFDDTGYDDMGDIR